MSKLAIGLMLVVFSLCEAVAQSYPNGPIHLLVGQPPGGAEDVVARQLAKQLGESLGQQVIVENKAGAAGLLAVEQLAKSAPDGRTIMLASRTSLVHVRFYSKPTYDVDREIFPIVVTSTSSLVLVSNPAAMPAETVKELIALAKQQPGKFACASAGLESMSHLAMELFNQTARTDLVHIPYKGSVPAVTDVIAGQVAVAFLPVGTALPHIRAGKLRALAVTSSGRLAALPDVPTLNESGLENFEFVNWNALIAPARTPTYVIEKLRDAATKALAHPDVKAAFSSTGVEMPPGGPVDPKTLIRRDAEAMDRIVRGCRGCCCGQTCGGLCLE